MSYVDGFVIAIPKSNKQAFTQHANTADAVFLELGATRILECWEDDVHDGKLTDFRRAVQAKPDEAVAFSWVEWPDKATRDTAWGKIMEDERMKPGDMPFDGKRMMWGGFEPVVYSGG